MIPYHIAAERAQRVGYTVALTRECPCCSADITVTVNGDEAEITEPCDERCDRRSHFPLESFLSDAVARAMAERDDYARHLREYDPN
jgi:hypothetical protein